MIIFLMLFIIVSLWGIQPAEKGQYYTLPLSMTNVTMLKGILAIEIVLGHAYGKINGTELLYLNSRIGVWVVGLFFFLSGYGLMNRLHKKQDYLNKFISRRILKVLAPVAIVFLIEVIYSNHYEGLNVGGTFGFFENIIEQFGTYIFDDWFVCEIIIVYFIWYLVYKFLCERIAFLILLLCILGLNLYGFIFQIGTRWYGSTACFLFGIWFEKQEIMIKNYLCKYYFIVLTGTLICLVSLAFVFLKVPSNMAISTFIINITCGLLCIIMYLFFMKFNIYNRIMMEIGKVSWEIYVVHRMILRIFRETMSKYVGLKMFLMLISIIIMAWIINAICNIGDILKKGNLCIERKEFQKK